MGGMTLTPRIRLLLLSAAAVAFLVSPAAAFAQTKLIADVGLNDGFTISLTTEAGAPVRDLPAGAYDIEVRDHSELHNFHLTGPGVNISTPVETATTQTFSVTFQDKSRYTFICDVHPGSMRGTFTIGGGPPAPPPKPKVTRLNASVGPGMTISLRTTAGRRVSALKAGRYRIVVSDRSKLHSFHLRGPGVNKRTAVPFRGTVTWTVTLKRGRYSYVCDSHAAKMKGSFRVT
jgi:plastocyanin